MYVCMYVVDYMARGVGMCPAVQGFPQNIKEWIDPRQRLQS